MNEQPLHFTYTNPVVIGGIGGSGTSLIAGCLGRLGFFIGHDLNEANDNLWFTLLFKHEKILSCSQEEFNALIEIFLKGTVGGLRFTDDEIAIIKHLASSHREPLHSRSWLRKKADRLLSIAKRQPGRLSRRWGWKEPNSHIVLDRLIGCFPNVKYIHVARNGLDMAHSENQNQLRLWGKHFLGGDCSISPRCSLKYWCTVHRRILDLGRSLGANFLFLNYDDFCSRPAPGIERLCTFLELGPEVSQTADLTRSINPPGSIGRFKRYGTQLFDPDDVRYVSELGFDVLGEGDTGRAPQATVSRSPFRH